MLAYWTIIDCARMRGRGLQAAGLRRGWTHSRAENVPDVHAIAVPLRIAGEPYGLAVAGPEHCMAPNLARHANRLLQSGRRIAGDVGNVKAG